MEYKKIKVTAVNLDARKSVTITADMATLCKCATEGTVKKAIETQILESHVFGNGDLAKLRYQGRKDVLDEWKAMRPAVAEEEARTAAALMEGYDGTSSGYNLNRFLSAQEYNYSVALHEMQNGRKQGHWIWYIFPQQKGLGCSYNSEYYGLNGLGEAKAYVQHPVLGHRLREICQALLDNHHKGIHYIMGSGIDVIKLRSSMELFDRASPNDIFEKVLRTFY